MRVIACLLIEAIAACSGGATSGSSVEGLWSADARSKGGLGVQWFFGSAGRVTSSFGALVDFTYRIDGNKLITTYTQEGAPPEETVEEFVIAGDTLTLNPNDPQKKQVLNRVGKSPTEGSIVGEWTYTHYTGGPAIERYSSTGHMQLSVPFQSLEGTYTVSEGRVSINLKGQPPANLRVNVSGTKMTMTDGNRSHAFTRFDF